MSEAKKPLEFRDENNNWSELDELQKHFTKSSQIPREMVSKYIDALSTANAKKILKEESRIKAAEFLKSMLDQKLATWIEVTQPETLDIFIKSWFYNVAILEKWKSELLEAKQYTLQGAKYGKPTDQAVFNLRMKNWQLLWKAGKFWSEAAYEKVYSVPNTSGAVFPEPKKVAKSPLDIADENKDGTDLDELHNFIRSNQNVSREMISKYMDALALSKSKNSVKSETRELASDFLKKMLDQRLEKWIIVTELETIDLYIRSWFYNNAILEKWKAELIEAKKYTEQGAKYGRKDQAAFDMRLRGWKLLWKSHFWATPDEKTFWTVKTELTGENIHSATPSWDAESQRVDGLFAEMTSTDVTISWKKPEASVIDMRIEPGDTVAQAPEKKKSKRKVARKSSPDQNLPAQEVAKWDEWTVRWTNVRVRNEDGTFEWNEKVSTWAKFKMTWETKNMKRGLYYWVESDWVTKFIHANYIKIEKWAEKPQIAMDELTVAKNDLQKCIDKAADSNDESNELEIILGRAARISRKKNATLEEIKKATAAIDEYFAKKDPKTVKVA
ncbi:MAG: hypothetical protein ACD_2C00132G0002 [uncultured bacterium (gcode 4)]|uniref:Uncharacterized protein n=1 Tax=uncultured bacterium (gcode 4) TaxID=1234023 RepID=K2H1C1_9BACT|nr:MAG: hypothetical protein ACD_2C00132G0002 [uncultured bacterium (gcode 4)]